MLKTSWTCGCSDVQVSSGTLQGFCTNPVPHGSWEDVKTWEAQGKGMARQVSQPVVTVPPLTNPTGVATTKAVAPPTRQLGTEGKACLRAARMERCARVCEEWSTPALNHSPGEWGMIDNIIHSAVDYMVKGNLFPRWSTNRGWLCPMLVSMCWLPIARFIGFFCDFKTCIWNISESVAWFCSQGMLAFFAMSSP